MKRLQLFGILFVVAFLFFNSCKKDVITTSMLYVPTASDVTNTATLAELQQGLTIYENNCAACHGLYSPDSYTPATWKSILSSMAPKAGLSAANVALVTKYVSRGK